jgi:thiamine pyrophosphokinase
MNNKKKVVLFANGDFPKPANVLSQISDQDILIAVDGGLKYISASNLVPDLIIGDLDSADPEAVENFRNLGVKIRKFPVEKDETDLELALTASLDYQPDAVWIVGGLGKRIDQTLGNIFLIASPKFASLDMRLVDGVQEIFVIRKSQTIQGQSGDRVSLLPLNSPVTGISTNGLYYPLENETLSPHQTRGISNRMTQPDAKITIREGLLLCIHDKSNINERD